MRLREKKEVVKMTTIYNEDDKKWGVYVQNLPRRLISFVRTSEKYQVLNTGAVMFTGVRELIRLPTLENIEEDYEP